MVGTPMNKVPPRAIASQTADGEKLGDELGRDAVQQLAEQTDPETVHMKQGQGQHLMVCVRPIPESGQRADPGQE